MKDLLKIPNLPAVKKMIGIQSNKNTNKKKSSAVNIEKYHFSRVLLLSLLVLVVICVVILLILHYVGDGIGSWSMHISNAMDNIIAAAIVLIFLDTIVAHNNENRRKRDERRSIIRHNRIIQPVIDMYLVRKNMVITPENKKVKKFQINAKFEISDMRDMYGPSELISDVGLSKIEVYHRYQTELQNDLVHLVEAVDFTHYSNLCDAAMKFINATSYGSSALSAAVGYQHAKSGTKSMKSMIITMIKNEPSNGNFIDSNSTMKNIYLLYQTINDQEIALKNYLEIVQEIIAEEPEKKKSTHNYE